MDRRTLMTWALGIAAICSGCNEPGNYDDCILKYVKAGMDKVAVMVVQDACREKFPEEDEPQTPEEQAIQLAKNAYILNKVSTNETKIQEFLRHQKGSLHVIGWKAKSIDDQTFLVTFSFSGSSAEFIHSDGLDQFIDFNRDVGGQSVLSDNPSLLRNQLDLGIQRAKEKTRSIRAWPFEVNLEAGIVRSILDDPELKSKYGFSGN